MTVSTNFKSSSTSQKISLFEAFVQVSLGKLSGEMVYDQLPKEVQDMLDQISRSISKSGFSAGGQTLQSMVCQAILRALTTTEISSAAAAVAECRAAKTEPSQSGKKWWQFWRG